MIKHLKYQKFKNVHELHFTTLLVSVITILLVNSCQKDRLVGEYYLTPEMKNQIPFKGNEKIIFSCDSLNNLEMTSTRRNDTIYKIYTDSYQSDYILCEHDNISIMSEKYSLNISIGTCDFDPPGVKFNFAYLDGNYHFQSYFPSLYSDSSRYFLDSLLITGKWIYNIYYDTVAYFHTKPFPDDLPQYPVRSYYSTSFGVVKINFSDGSTWELKEIVW